MLDLPGLTDIDLRARALDTSPSRPGYDVVVLDRDDDPDNGIALRLEAGRWAPMRWDTPAGVVSRWAQLQQLDPTTGQATLYLGASFPFVAQPPEYAARVLGRIGPYPGYPNHAGLRTGAADEATWWAEVERNFDYVRDVGLDLVRGGCFELAVIKLGGLDGLGHVATLRHARQEDYAAEDGTLRQRFAGYLERGYQQVDRIVTDLMEAAPSDAVVVVVSEHGMLANHTVLRLNQAFADAGLGVTADENTQIYAHTSGSSAHVFVNLAGREKGGVVPRSELARVTERIIAVAEALRDPQTGQRVLDRVLARDALGTVFMGQPATAGDVWVRAAPGYALSGALDASQPLWAPAFFRGMHGHSGHHRENHGLFYVVGGGVEARPLGIVRLVDVAPTVAALLGINPPAQSQGRDVLGRAPSD